MTLWNTRRGLPPVLSSVVRFLLALIMLLVLSPPFAAAQLKLSEPKSDEDSGEPVRPSDDLPTSSRLRKRLSRDQGEAKIPTLKSAQKATETSPSASSPKSSEESSEKPAAGSGVHSLEHAMSSHVARPVTSHDPRTFSLIAQDAQQAPFFSASVPRTVSHGEDCTLNDVCHVGPLCWAVGERGVVCTSTDGGVTWNSSFVPLDCSLRSVCFLTNRIGWTGGFRILPGTSQTSAVLFGTRDGGASWSDLSIVEDRSEGAESVSLSELPGILKVQFFGLDAAVAVTMPVISRHGTGVFRSDDGGASWKPISADQPGCVWSGGAFLSESEGIVVGRHLAYAAVVSDQTVVINPRQPTLRQMRGVSLDASGKGWMAGDGAAILKTDNSGITWAPPEGDMARMISELVDLHAVAHQGQCVLLSGNPAGVMLRSADDGETWQVVKLPAAGVIRQIRFLTDSDVLAVGSFGQVVRSADAGQTWVCVRSGGLRSGLLNLVTESDSAAWQLMAAVAGEGGLRSVTLQMSESLNSDEPLKFARTMMPQTPVFVSQLGGNDAASDWFLPRPRPEIHNVRQRLIAEWTRQTDGQLQRLLPLRLARDLRNWRPAIVVIEPASENDAVAEIWREVLPRAMQLAESDEHSPPELEALGLAPWSVRRVLARTDSQHHTSLSFDDSDLLPVLGTTCGLICDAVISGLKRPEASMTVLRKRADYEIVYDRDETVGLNNLLDQIDPAELVGALRPVGYRSGEDVNAIKSVLQKAKIESSAAQGISKLHRSEESLIAELRNLGQDLPESLAVKQLRDLGLLNLEQNNMEGYLAVQQEIVRRYPESDDARKAAEMLFLFYSSAETRWFRLRSAAQSQFGMAVMSVAPDGGTASDANVTQDSNAEFSAPQPAFQPPQSLSFSASATSPAEALHQRWDAQAATALKILSARRNTDSVRREIREDVILRHAANQRLQGQNGEYSNALAELARRSDQYAIFAACEMQMNAAASPGLMLFNLPRRDEQPFLDGQLTDAVWENAQEIRLRTFSSAGSNTDDVKAGVRPGDETSSFVMLAWDEEFLYLGARFERPPTSGGRVQLATNRDHDATHQNRDRLEFEIDTDRDFVTSFHLTVDESGLTSDRCWMLDRWNPKWYVAVDSDDAVWRVEAAIPFSELAARPAKPGDIWSVKLRRVVPGILQHELISPQSLVSTQGTGIVRFIRPKVVTKTRRP